MPSYDTPHPIDLAIDLSVGAIEIIASERTDTVVTVTPTDAGKAVDVRGADEAKIEFDGARMTVRGPRPRFSIIGPSESIDVTVEVPTGSRLTAKLSVGALRATGRLGATRVKTSSGPVELDETGDLWVRAGHGSVKARTADGSVEITADHGQIELSKISGDSLLKASHGNVTIGESGGNLEAKLAYGDLQLTRAHASVSAKTAYGSIQMGEVSSGSIEVESGYGEVSIGVRAGIPAWLDLASREGRVRNALEADRAPQAGEQTVEVRARTQFGDISIGRAKK